MSAGLRGGSTNRKTVMLSVWGSICGRGRHKNCVGGGNVCVNMWGCLDNVCVGVRVRVEGCPGSYDVADWHLCATRMGSNAGCRSIVECIIKTVSWIYL